MKETGMVLWHDYADIYPGEGHTVSGTVKIAQAVYSPQLDNRRDVLVYLPPSYGRGERRYPVLYMHDGQNLFDAATSYPGESRVAETLEALSAEGLDTIVVGLPNVDAQFPGSRLDEYSPFKGSALRAGRGGRGDLYLAFLCETVKPLIDSSFRTLPDRAHTGVMGSSMGGLISLYALFSRPDVFGFAGVMSPAFWFTADDAIYRYVQAADFVPGKIYMDIGTNEGGVSVTPDMYVQGARRMADLLTHKGYRTGHDLLYSEDVGAIHHESAWARRLPDALRFLLS
jgi:predicted alpha/beta superfamily hydrolase